MACDTGQNIDYGTRIDRKAEVTRLQVQCSIRCQRERRPAEFNRTDAEKQMVHDRIADNRRFKYVAGFNAGVRDNPCDQVICTRTN